MTNVKCHQVPGVCDKYRVLNDSVCPQVLGNCDKCHVTSIMTVSCVLRFQVFGDKCHVSSVTLLCPQVPGVW